MLLVHNDGGGGDNDDDDSFPVLWPLLLSGAAGMSSPKQCLNARVACLNQCAPDRPGIQSNCTMRVQVIRHFKPCVNEIYLHHVWALACVVRVLP